MEESNGETCPCKFVRHGRLGKLYSDEYYGDWADCQECGADNIVPSNYCRNCGAKFVLEETPSTE